MTHLARQRTDREAAVSVTVLHVELEARPLTAVAAGQRRKSEEQFLKRDRLIVIEIEGAEELRANHDGDGAGGVEARRLRGVTLLGVECHTHKCTHKHANI